VEQPWRYARDIIFHTGDILHDENLSDIIVLLSRGDSTHGFETHGSVGGGVTEVSIWKLWSSRDGVQYYSEFGLQNLVFLSVFSMYRAVECTQCGWCGGKVGKF
jgi:hypothetical protein